MSAPPSRSQASSLRNAKHEGLSVGDKPLIDIGEAEWAIVKTLLQRHVPDREVWAFGSRATWTAKAFSDLDLAILGERPLTSEVSAALAGDLADSDLPWKVDLVDWATTGDSFRKIIERDRVVVHESDRKGLGGIGASAKWQRTTLGEICRAQGGAIQTGPFGSQLHSSDYREIGVPVVMPTNLGDGGIVEDGIARIDQIDVERLGQHKLRLGDIVFSRRGDVTKNALIRNREAGWLCGTGCLKVRIGSEVIASSQFISYCLRLPDTKDWLIRHAVGATMPNLNTGILSAVPVDLPPLQVQLAIADFLESLDDRIAVLRETNATLETIAQALFKSWFVDFDPVRAKMEGRAPEGMDEATATLFPDGFEESELGLVPRGWRAGTLGEVAQTVRNQIQPSELHKEINYVGLEHIPRKCFSLNSWATADGLESAKAAFSAGDILFGKLRPYFHKVVLAPFDGVCSTDILVCQAKSSPYFGYVAMQLFSTALISYAERLSNGAKMPRIGWSDLADYPAIIPNALVAEEYTRTVSLLFARMNANVLAIPTLASIRDTLLPHLISGKLRLPDAASEIDACTK